MAPRRGGVCCVASSRGSVVARPRRGKCRWLAVRQMRSMRSFRLAYSTGDSASLIRAGILASLLSITLPICLATAVPLRAHARALKGWGVAYIPWDGSFDASHGASPTLAVVHAGTPFTAFWATVTDPTYTPKVPPSTSVTGGLVLRGGSSGWTPTGVMRVVPLQPAWGGLVLNILVGFLTLMFVDRVFCFFVRGRRARSNRCLRCGYPRPASDQCPECGANLLRQSRARQAHSGSFIA